MVSSRGQRLLSNDCLRCYSERSRYQYTDLKPSSPRDHLRAAKFVLAVAVAGLLFYGGILQRQQRQQEQQRRQPQHLNAVPSASTSGGVQPPEAIVPEVNISLWNSYSDGEEFGRDRLYPWSYLAEPHKKTVLKMVDAPHDGLVVASIRWAIDGVQVGTGNSVETVFKKLGTHRCHVTVSYALASGSGSGSGSGIHLKGVEKGGVSPKEDEGEDEGAGQERQRRQEDLSQSTSTSVVHATATHSFDVTVKYVRREIRNLTDRDREVFFNAVSVLQRVPSAVGREIYGEKYYSKDYFNRLHLHYGAQRDCDHWHDGPGFVTSHVAISLMYEQALQSINPSIALPYWDFTVEGTEFDWTNFRTSGVFSDDWFGEAAPRNSLMTPERGRFGMVPVMTNATEYSEVSNAYGLLRSPWNSHPDPFLTRHDHVFGYTNNRKPSGCKQYRDAARQNSWVELTEAMNAGAHGHIHELLGGTWALEWMEFHNRTDDIILPFTHIIVPLMKYLWRADFLECPTLCDFSLKWVDCQCALNAGMATGESPAEVLEASGVLSQEAGAFFYDQDLKLIENLADEEGHAFSQIPGYTAKETEDIFAELLRLLSTPMRIGTHYEGTSTNDVTFWVIHPTFDRLWHLGRLEQMHGEGEMFDDTWLGGNDCYGHNPTDVQPFHGLFAPAHDRNDHKYQQQQQQQRRAEESEDGGQQQQQGQQQRTWRGVAPIKSYYTNEMLYELLSPGGLEIPYVYDNFEWPHCDAIGVHLRSHE